LPASYLPRPLQTSGQVSPSMQKLNFLIKKKKKRKEIEKIEKKLFYSLDEQSNPLNPAKHLHLPFIHSPLPLQFDGHSVFICSKFKIENYSKKIEYTLNDKESVL
jgi:hypothetical protein